MRGVTYVRRKYYVHSVFQPALPMRGVTVARRGIPQSSSFQPALPMRGVTVMGAQADAMDDISTRTPHAGSDQVLSDEGLL